MEDGTVPTVVVPAAGESRRFRDAGVDCHKASITFSWKGEVGSMLQHVLRDVAGWPLRVGVSEEQAWLSRDDQVVVGPTEGQADTVYRTIEGMPAGVPILVVNCDAAFGYPLDLFARQCAGAGLPYGALVFPGNREPQYSYVDSFPMFTVAWEKRPISPWAMAGAYWFAQAADLRHAIGKLRTGGPRHAGEYYLSSAFQFYSGFGLAVAMPRDLLHVWGTPEDLARDSDIFIENQDIWSKLEVLR